MEKQFKGTQGNWEFVNTELSDFAFTTVICEKQVIANINSVKENRIANAKLISKAPELLSLIQDLIDMESIIHISLHQKAVDLLNTILE